MNEMNPELRAAIDTAKQRVKVDSYFTTGMNKGLKGRAQGYWGGTLLGILTGAMVGSAVVAALAMANVAIPAAIGVYGIIIGFSGLGAVIGGGAGADIGAATGATAGVIAEFERRQKADKLEAEILKSPEKQAEVIAAYRANPVIEKDNTLQETFATSASTGKAFGKLFDLKTTVVAMGICAAVGVLMVTGGFLLAGSTAIGFGVLQATTLGGAAAMDAAIGAVTGITFGINYPMIFASATQWTADLLSQKMVRGKSNFEHVKTVPEVQREAQMNRAASLSSAPVLALAKDEAPSTSISDINADGRQAPALQLVKG